ncbi:WbqC family protein [Castellaniella sp.]|uniref:WbqC family protein n=1 Tax=Castellaniella sp. TaxID=1955812 RepID=UPI00356AD940
MTRLAGMQPYFFPYIGYWRLIHSADVFVLFDEAQYMRQGWVNRNRILMNDGTWRYIIVPVIRHARRTAIKDVQIATDTNWHSKILKQLGVYKVSAPYFDEIYGFVDSLLAEAEDETIGHLNCRLIRQICDLLTIDTDIVVSSEFSFDYSAVDGPGDWPLVHALAFGATELINPAGGFALLDESKFRAHGIRLTSMPATEVVYGQPHRSLQSSLSIIDVLMYNGVLGTRKLLDIHGRSAL